MQESHSSFVIAGPSLCLEHELTEAGRYGLRCSAGKIQAIDRLEILKKQYPRDEFLEFSPDSVLLPGMIDLHIHGAAGFDVMDATPKALQGISHALLQEGTTGFFATTMTASSDNILQALQNISTNAIEGPLKEHLLGIHLEGPFLAKSRMGAQSETHIVSPDLPLFDRFFEVAQGRIKLLTVAVEDPKSLPFIRDLVKRGVKVSIGHTDATFQECQAAIEAGASHATHLFNAMRGIHHREPGCACALLMDDRVTAELIADGIHVHPDMLKFAFHVKGLDRIVLVTDAMRAQCLGAGVFDLGGQAVTVKGKEARLKNGSLAGSVLSMKEAFFNAISFANLTCLEASHLVSRNPAKVAGCFAERGSLSLGKRADFWIVNQKQAIEATFFSGNRVR